MSPSSRKYRLVVSALGGLACGLLLRHFRTAGVHAAIPASGENSAVAAAKPAAAPDEWEPFLQSYAKLPPPASAETLERGTKAEADAFLRMLLKPVTAGTIREGIAFLNSTDTMRYWAVLPSLFAHWAKTDPEAASAMMQELRDPQSRDMLAWETFHALAATDPRAAFAKAAKLPSPMLRGPALHALAGALSPEQVPGILRESMKDGRPPQLMSAASFQKDALKAWLQSDPDAPLKFAASIEDPAWRRAMLATVLNERIDLRKETGGAMESDTATLLELARDSRNAPGITDRLKDLISQAAPDAGAILAAMPSSADREDVLAQATKEMLYLMGQKSIPESVTKTAAAGLDHLARSSAGAGQSAEFQTAFLNAATSGEVPVFAAAVGWLSTHDPARLAELTAQASAKIPFTVAKLLSAMPPSAERDQAITIFAETHAATDPERAAAWAESITDPAKRAAALAAVSRQGSNQSRSGQN